MIIYALIPIRLCFILSSAASRSSSWHLGSFHRPHLRHEQNVAKPPPRDGRNRYGYIIHFLR